LSEIPESLRRLVETRAEGRCEYCQIPARGQIAWFPIDHIVPRSREGKTELDNLAFACPRCNAHKWAHVVGDDSVTGEKVGLFNPREHVWGDHFSWSRVEPFHIEGKTPIGRATAIRLRMNEIEVVAIRRLLSELGLMTFPANS
jgi:hypothetical protein